MNLQPKHTVCLFDRFRLEIPAGLKCHQDGLPGKRVLFISDRKESFNISFEEGMRMMDMLPLEHMEPSCQCCKDGKYIHQRRTANKMGSYAFFHFELQDDKGRTVYLPGQMTAEQHYPWAGDIEPVLLELTEGLYLISDGRKEE